MNHSKHNIFSKITGSDEFFLVNILSGNADILNSQEAEKYRSGKIEALSADYLEKGYVVEADAESKQYKLAYLDFLDRRENDEIQIFYVPWYACNFDCSYCYQAEYAPEASAGNGEVVEAFFKYVNREFAGRRKYVTIFGGEPLLKGERTRNEIKKIVRKSAEYKLDLAIVTNGYHLADYVDILKLGRIREIQVTLDGTRTVHDKRRYLKDGAGTFEQIVAGIDAALENHFPINLRVVVDKDNFENLIDLAHFAIEKGWTKNPLFKTQLGRNYELHTCQLDPKRLFLRISLYEKVYEMVRRHPEFLEFHRPAYSISKHLFENGELPEPLFDSCPGTKTEWAFDYTGKFYACTATVGKQGEELGTFYPAITKNEDIIEKWEDRDVTTIPQCRDCTVQLACGGGCAAVAKNRTGEILAPDCRPVRELIEMGIGLYFNEEE